MKKLAFVGMFAMAAFAAEYKGTISDAKCAANHADASEKAQKCVNACIRGGQAAVLVTADGKVLKIAETDKIKEHLGHKVVITGNVANDTLTVEKVAMQ